MTGWANPDDAALARILRDTRSIAVVGASATATRPSHEVYSYLAGTGDYRLYPVNPTITELDGAPVYAGLADVPEVPDLIDVFRRTEQLPTVLAEVLRLAPLPKTLWLQQGLWDERVARDAQAAGLQVVMDRCLKVDHARLH